MSVKKKDRHLSRSECLNKARKLVQQTLILTRPAITNDDGAGAIATRPHPNC